MLVRRAYKTELDLHNEQVTACKQHVGAARFAYNWGLRTKQERYKATGQSPSAIELHRELNARKSTDLPAGRRFKPRLGACGHQADLRRLPPPQTGAAFVLARAGAALVGQRPSRCVLGRDFLQTLEGGFSLLQERDFRAILLLSVSEG
jgi:hypothetical protein